MKFLILRVTLLNIWSTNIRRQIDWKQWKDDLCYWKIAPKIELINILKVGYIPLQMFYRPLARILPVRVRKFKKGFVEYGEEHTVCRFFYTRLIWIEAWKICENSDKVPKIKFKTAFKYRLYCFWWSFLIPKTSKSSFKIRKPSSKKLISYKNPIDLTGIQIKHAI